MPLALLVNPASAGGRALKLLPRIEPALDARRVAFRVRATRDLEHGVERALRAVEAGEIPVVVSGDGLIGAIGGAMAGAETPLGIIPGGRGNDLARVLGIPDEPERRGRGRSPPATRRLIDVGEANGRRFLGIVSVGFDSEANRLANETQLIRGNLVYAYAALRTLVGWKPARFTIRVDEERIRFTGYSVSVANNSAFGGGMFIAPDAELDDGEFDVVDDRRGAASCASWVTCRRCSRAPTSSTTRCASSALPHLELERQPPVPGLRRRRAPHRPAGLAAGPAPRPQRDRAPAPGRGLS